jgi:putrescine transport system substrate-binding protein
MIRLLASVALTLSLVTAATAQERVVNVYNWSDYVDPKALDEFTKQTGIKVVYDTYDNNEIVETKLLAGKSGYDIVVPSGPFVQRLIGAKVFQKLDKTKLPNLANQWPEVTQRLAVFDPGNQYAVNYMWGTTGIGINVKKVKEILGDVPLNTWDLVMKPEISSRLKACGIYMLDSPEDLFPGVMAYLGLNPDSKRIEDLNKAGDALFRVHQRSGQRRHLRGGGLFGRHDPGQEPRRGSQERCRGRLCHSARRCVDVVRQLRDPGGCQERGRGA